MSLTLLAVSEQAHSPWLVASCPVVLPRDRPEGRGGRLGRPLLPGSPAPRHFNTPEALGPALHSERFAQGLPSLLLGVSSPLLGIGHPDPASALPAGTPLSGSEIQPNAGHSLEAPPGPHHRRRRPHRPGRAVCARVAVATKSPRFRRRPQPGPALLSGARRPRAGGFRNPNPAARCPLNGRPAPARPAPGFGFGFG